MINAGLYSFAVLIAAREARHDHLLNSSTKHRTRKNVSFGVWCGMGEAVVLPGEAPREGVLTWAVDLVILRFRVTMLSIRILGGRLRGTAMIPGII